MICFKSSPFFSFLSWHQTRVAQRLRLSVPSPTSFPSHCLSRSRPIVQRLHRDSIQTILYSSVGTKNSPVFKQSRRARIISVCSHSISTSVLSPLLRVDWPSYYHFRHRTRLARHHNNSFIALSFPSNTGYNLVAPVSPTNWDFHFRAIHRHRPQRAWHSRQVPKRDRCRHVTSCYGRLSRSPRQTATGAFMQRNTRIGCQIPQVESKSSMVLEAQSTEQRQE